MTGESFEVSFDISSRNIMPIFFENLCLLDAQSFLLPLDEVLNPESIDNDTFCFSEIYNLRKSRGNSIVLAAQAQMQHFVSECLVNEICS